jgi:hypothetical protein
MKKFFLFIAAALLCANVNADKAVTVNNNGSATQKHFPVYGDNADSEGHKVQAIYLADQLSAITVGSEIKSLTFYSSKQNQSWGKAEFKVSLAKTDYSFFQNASGAWATASDGSTLTKVYDGPLSVADGELTINFTTPYAYEGGNLLIQVEVSRKGTSDASSFYSAANTAYLIKYAYSGSSYEDKQPKVTLVIAGGGDDPVSEDCNAPTAVTVESFTESTATVSWKGAASQYQYCLAFEGNLPDWTEATLTDQKSVSLSGLYEEQKYYFYVRSYCSETEVSEAIKATFKTACARLNVPWIETFTRDASGSQTAGDVAPECWVISSAAPAVTIVSEKEDDGEGNQIATGQQFLQARGGSASTAQVFALPLFNAKLDTCELAFDYWTNVVSADYGSLEIGYMTNPADASAFVSLKTFEQTTTSKHVVFPLNVLPAGIQCIAFRFAGGTSNFGRVSMDNFILAGIGHSGEIDPSQEIIPDASIYSLSYCEAGFTWYSYSADAFAIGLFDATTQELVGGIAVTTGECDRFAYQDGVGFPEGDDYENHYYCSTKWILNVDDEGLQRGEAWDADVINVGTATTPLLGLRPGKYQVQVYELVQGESSYEKGDLLATIPFELVSKEISNLAVEVAEDKKTATLTWEQPELASGERLYVSVRAGEVVAFDNFDDSKIKAVSPLTVEVIEGKSYEAIFQIIDRNSNPVGSEVTLDFTVGVNNYEPSNAHAEVFGGDNVTFSWDVAAPAAFYDIVLYWEGEYYSTLSVYSTTKTTTMPKDGLWSWTVQPFTQGESGKYFAASNPVAGNDFVTKAADVPEDAIVMDVWGMEAAYLDEYESQFPEGLYGWMVMFATGEEGGTGYPQPWFLVYTTKEGAISGVYNISRNNLDLESTYMNTNGTQAGCIMATDAELRLQFDGYEDEYFDQGYRYGYYTGSFRMVAEDGKTYVGKFMEQFCNSFNFSTYGSSIRDHKGMWDEDPDYDPWQAVENIETGKAETQKVLQNGQLFIIRDGKTYNVLGTVVK